MLNKAVKNAAVILLGSLMLLGNASAKDQKIAIVDVQAIAAQMPQMATIQETVQAEFKNQVEELQKLQADAKYNYDKLQREGATMSDAQKEELRTTIMGQQKTLEEKSKPLQQAMQRRQRGHHYAISSEEDALKCSLAFGPTPRIIIFCNKFNQILFF